MPLHWKDLATMFGKILGLTLALTLCIVGLALAGVAIGMADPIGWALIAAGLGIFGVGASLTMMWKEAR